MLEDVLIGAVQDTQRTKASNTCHAAVSRPDPANGYLQRRSVECVIETLAGQLPIGRSRRGNENRRYSGQPSPRCVRGHLADIVIALPGEVR